MGLSLTPWAAARPLRPLWPLPRTWAHALLLALRRASLRSSICMARHARRLAHAQTGAQTLAAQPRRPDALRRAPALQATGRGHPCRGLEFHADGDGGWLYVDGELVARLPDARRL